MEQIINFYSAIDEYFIKTVCKLLDKCYNTQLNTLVLVGDKTLENQIDNSLWSFSSTKFIPHGCSNDTLPHLQPIYITTNYENPNQAQILTVINPINLDDTYIDRFKKVLIVFNTNETDKKQSARNLYSYLQKSAYRLQYFQQTEQLEWQQIQS